MIVAGDSLAVGIAAVLHTQSLARVGMRSREGAALIQRTDDKRLIVSLGANDLDNDTRFRQRIRAVVRGRSCVAWVAVTRKPHLDRQLAQIAREDPRLHRISLHGIPRADGIHPRDYRALAHRAQRACKP